MWRLSTFGGLSLKDEGSLQIPSVAAQRRPLALLALLADSGEAGLSREKLLLYLWPESDEERARNTLRQLLHSLRRGLNEPDLLLGTNELRLNPAAITSDVGDFVGGLSRRDPERVATVYRGAFLDGFHLGGSAEFEYWMDARRAEYASRAASAIESLARETGQRGQPVAALDWWRRVAALDPLNSRIAIELMNALAASGNPAGALQHARVHETLVREELGAPPDPAVVAVAQRLREVVTVPVPPPAPRAAAPAAGQGQVVKLRDRLQTAVGDRFTVERELAHRDGTSRVFVAHDRKHDRKVALKVLHPALASALDLERFRREIAVTARLRHPYILPILESGEVGEQPWYATPQLDGESLRERLVREPKLPSAEALHIAAELAEALEYAHRQGVIHRDIKPENILLAEGHAFVTNFGLATALISSAGPKLTGTGILVGTPAYMSPEQARGALLDPVSDVYSLGCVLYELVVGAPPHSGPTPQAIIAKRTAEGTQPALPQGLAIPDRMSTALARALAPQPGDRLSAAEFLHHVRQVSPDAGEPRSPAAATDDVA
nr:protein kinase [Gemmatimonadales bacterium]